MNNYILPLVALLSSPSAFSQGKIGGGGYLEPMHDLLLSPSIRKTYFTYDSPLYEEECHFYVQALIKRYDVPIIKKIPATYIQIVHQGCHPNVRE